MSITDDALAWLLSLSAACTNSPTPPDFTDWLHISPTNTTPSPYHLSSSPPFQDVSASSKINLLSPNAFSLNYRYDFADHFTLDGVGSSSDSGRSYNAIGFDSVSIPTSVQQLDMFNQHNRMLSLGSTSASTTLINTPSPRSLSGFPAAAPPGFSITSPFSPPPNLFACSPGTKFMQELQHSSSFGAYYDLTASSEVAPSISDLSPVIRADKVQEYLVPEREQPTPKAKKKKRRTRAQKPSLFEDRLRASVSTHAEDAVARQDNVTLQADSTIIDAPLEQPAPLPLVPLLLSPCKLVLPDFVAQETVIGLPLTLELPTAGQEHSEQNNISTPLCATYDLDTLSPLTPLTPLSSSPASAPPLKIILRLKRKPSVTLDPSTPIRRSKRPRRSVAATFVDSPLSSEDDTMGSLSPLSSSPDYSPAGRQGLVSVFSNRTLPPDIEISDNFPLFYRRFPASSYFQIGDAESPCTLFDMSHPGGNYNPPRAPLDLYTPRFVKGKGVEKVGLCPICLEPHERGGEKKKLWLAMKFSAFNYHMQYAHGISASTGRPFSPPVAFRVVPRQNPGKKEKRSIQQGKCHKCAKWVAVEGIKDMESKVKELHWWKHAAACHHDSTLEGEGDYYETDAVLAKLLALQVEGSA